MTGPVDGQNLCDADIAMLDRLVEAGFDLEALGSLSDEEQARAQRLLSLVGLLDGYPVEDAGDALVDATLARIDREEARRSERMRVDTAQIEVSERGFRIRVPDFVTVAAMLLIVASVVLPMMHSNRVNAQRNECANNLRLVGHGLANYAADHQGDMPVTAAASLGSVFGDLVPQRVDAGALAREGYCSSGHLDCPGHADTTGSFSCQTQGARRLTLQRIPGVTVVMGDLNPVLAAMLAGQKFDPMTSSDNHGGGYQNLLQSDGSTFYLLFRPMLGNDNIWLPDRQPRLDIFLSHER